MSFDTLKCVCMYVFLHTLAAYEEKAIYCSSSSACVAISMEFFGNPFNLWITFK